MSFHTNPIDDDRDPWEIMNDLPDEDELSASGMHEIGDGDDEEEVKVAVADEEDPELAKIAKDLEDVDLEDVDLDEDDEDEDDDDDEEDL